MFYHTISHQEKCADYPSANSVLRLSEVVLRFDGSSSDPGFKQNVSAAPAPVPAPVLAPSKMCSSGSGFASLFPSL